MKAEDMLKQRKAVRVAKVHWCANLYELLLSVLNQPWQSDSTWIRIPGYGWRYEITDIDHYSYHLLANCFLLTRKAHDAIVAPKLAQREVLQCSRFDVYVLTLLTSNGSNYLSKHFEPFANIRFKHVCFQYPMYIQLNMLERLYASLKREEMHWNRYYNLEEARTCLAAYRFCYCQVGPYWALRLFDCNQLISSDVNIHDLVLKTSKWQGCARPVRKELEEKIRDLGVEAVDNTNEIRQEKFTSTQMKWDSQCFVNWRDKTN